MHGLWDVRLSDLGVGLSGACFAFLVTRDPIAFAVVPILAVVIVWANLMVILNARYRRVYSGLTLADWAHTLVCAGIVAVIWDWLDALCVFPIVYSFMRATRVRRRE